MEEITISVGGNSPRPRMKTVGSVPGVAPDAVDTARDARETLVAIYEMLKLIQSRLDENMPYILKATNRDGG